MNDELDRARKEGRIDATLEEHALHLAKINGSIDRAIVVTEHLDKTMRDGLAAVESAVRTLQEEGRLAEERVNVAASTLARETERRREELAATATAASLSEGKSDRKFTHGQQTALLVLAVLALIGTIVGLYIASRTGTHVPRSLPAPVQG